MIWLPVIAVSIAAAIGSGIHGLRIGSGGAAGERSCEGSGKRVRTSSRPRVPSLYKEDRSEDLSVRLGIPAQDSDRTGEDADGEQTS